MQYRKEGRTTLKRIGSKGTLAYSKGGRVKILDFLRKYLMNGPELWFLTEWVLFITWKGSNFKQINEYIKFKPFSRIWKCQHMDFYSRDVLVYECALKQLQKQSFVDVLQNRSSCKFRTFHRKTPVLEFFLIKLQVKACNFIKRRLQHRCFPAKFSKFLRTPFFTEHLWWLLFFAKKLPHRC